MSLHGASRAKIICSIEAGNQRILVSFIKSTSGYTKGNARTVWAKKSARLLADALKKAGKSFR